MVEEKRKGGGAERERERKGEKPLQEMPLNE